MKSSKTANLLSLKLSRYTVVSHFLIHDSNLDITDTQASTAIANQLPGQLVSTETRAIAIKLLIHHCIDSAQHKDCKNS